MKKVRLFLAVSTSFIISGCSQLEQTNPPTTPTQEQMSPQADEQELADLKKELSELEEALVKSEKNLSDLQEIESVLDSSEMKEDYVMFSE
ncbi:hypothetical protein [Vagococcus intermedius]|uniref:Lipoprotein n=1 Tax=Vagococcus intermedius TaxID=2991418 RepID=A0AAF0CVE9_9ENTE|nr:hypothetical protein [Vagococcus intermedius]WEG73581.1 hypothetical protein OL234_01350 [Vagococcus intermedius]WEG75663.1 hypothetical protein OL235_01355 [Vagococcus intermedius]